MLSYSVGGDVGELEHWPFDNPASDYVIVRGNPRAYGRLNGGGPGHTWRSGVWRCTAGAVTCNEPGDEMQSILSGKVALIFENGDRFEYGPGDTFFTNKGDRVTWDISEDVTKVFFAINEDGF